MKTGLLIAVVFFTLSAALGVKLLWTSVTSLKRAIEAERWPVTTAVLNRVELTTSADSEGTPTYAVAVRYSYEVAGRSYRGEMLNPGYGGSSGYDQHRQIFEKLEHAKSVALRYNPERPEDSSITYGVTRSHFISLSFAFTWCVVLCGLLAIFMAFQLSDERLISRITVLEHSTVPDR